MLLILGGLLLLQFCMYSSLGSGVLPEQDLLRITVLRHESLSLSLFYPLSSHTFNMPDMPVCHAVPVLHYDNIMIFRFTSLIQMVQMFQRWFLDVERFMQCPVASFGMHTAVGVNIWQGHIISKMIIKIQKSVRNSFISTTTVILYCMLGCFDLH